MDWVGLNAMGRDEAETLVQTMVATRNPLLLGFRAKRIIAVGVYGGYEVGFFHRIGEELAFNSAHQR